MLFELFEWYLPFAQSLRLPRSRTKRFHCPLLCVVLQSPQCDCLVSARTCLLPHHLCCCSSFQHRPPCELHCWQKGETSDPQAVVVPEGRNVLLLGATFSCFQSCSCCCCCRCRCCTSGSHESVLLYFQKSISNQSQDWPLRESQSLPACFLQLAATSLSFSASQ